VIIIRNIVTGCGPDSFAWSGEGCVYGNGRIWVACEWGNFWCSVIARVLLKEY